MDKAIQIVENKIKEIQKYTHLGLNFKARELILKDILKELKHEKSSK